jgi:PAS domain S-box-containing protein
MHMSTRLEDTDRGPDLSARQHEILDLAANGYTDSAMALHLGISDGTVGTHWSRIRAKLGPFSRSELVAIGIRREVQQSLDVLSRERDALWEQLQAVINELVTVASTGAMCVGLLVFDSQRQIVFANRASHTLLGYRTGALVGLRFSDVIPERFRDVALAQIDALLAGPPGVIERGTLVVGLTRKGEELPLRVTRSTVRLGEQTFVVGSASRVGAPAPMGWPAASGEVEQRRPAKPATQGTLQSG